MLLFYSLPPRESRQIFIRIMNRCIFQSTTKLYHYTSIKNAKKILPAKRLKFGRLSKMNDINEVYRCLMFPHGLINIKQDYLRELDLYQQISLCRDYPQRGFNIPSMWGHYAENGCGVCLVFDKRRLTNAAEKYCCQKGCIRYRNFYNPDIYCNTCTAQQFFEENAKELFFEKTRDWRYEQEYRIVARFNKDTEHYLNFGDSLMAIIMYFTEDRKHSDSIFGSTIVSEIAVFAPDTPILEYGLWDGAPTLRDRNGNDWLAKGDCTFALSFD